MKVDFAEIGIGKIGISDFLNLKLPILANFGKIGNNIFLEFPLSLSLNGCRCRPYLKKSFLTGSPEFNLLVGPQGLPRYTILILTIE